jgi:prepilin-type N-terminal cleavage/methylation domain-containing protein
MRGREKCRRGFTLIELLAVVATIGVLAALLLPVLSRAKVKAQRTQCVSNTRQLGFAWSMYTSDSEGWLVQSYPGSSRTSPNPLAWVHGDMTDASEAADLNLLRAGKLYPYGQTVKIYQCPAVEEVTTHQGGKVLPARSFSMNSFMGAREPALGNIPTSAFRHVPFFSKESEIPSPSKLWVLIEESERSINDGFFVTDPDARVWIDFPPISNRRHGMAFDFTFADGHTETWNLRDPRTKKVSKRYTEQALNSDLERLARATTVPK